MKFRRDGTPQIQIGGRKPPYTLFVRAINTGQRGLRAEIEQYQSIERQHLTLAAQAKAEADALERNLDALIAAADQTNDEMHQVVVQQPADWINVLRRFVWREPVYRQTAEGRALSGQAPSAA